MNLKIKPNNHIEGSQSAEIVRIRENKYSRRHRTVSFINNSKHICYINDSKYYPGECYITKDIYDHLILKSKVPNRFKTRDQAWQWIKDNSINFKKSFDS